MAQFQQFHYDGETSVLPVAATLPQNTTDAEPRFDAQTVQEVIALAVQLQADHAETLSVAQVEAIGSDVGVEPSFVQQALAQITSQKEAKRQVSFLEQVPTHRLPKLAGWSKAIAI